MARLKIILPPAFNFTCSIPVRITDINYGGHVGNDTILSIIHESRLQFLRQLGYSELDMGGVGLIMSDVAIEFKNELFYGDTVMASVTAGEISRSSFELYYKLEKKTEDKIFTVAIARTGMVCYNYALKKIAPMPQGVSVKIGEI